MITLYSGTNGYAIRQAVKDLADDALQRYGPHGVERYDGEAVEPARLLDILQGASLFAAEKLVILRDAGRNKPLWEALGDRLEQLPDGVDVCLVETAPDKRTRTFKLLQKLGTVNELNEMTEAQAVNWVTAEADKRGVKLAGVVARGLVHLAGPDQWRLSNELDKLIAYSARHDPDGTIDEAAVKRLVEPTPQANVFALLDAALNRQPAALAPLLQSARTTEDPYRLIGLLSSQVLQLAALVYGRGKTPDVIAKDMKVHPYPLKKMQPLARRTSPAEMAAIAADIADLDNDTKSTGLEPWLLLERTLIKIASR
ncbi:DNA polymerase III subunit delta [Candidatus Saccharibacteria bacterium]|nr:DNA polymerase III subunit delta [Candidatus Saccharibacteria bacterium]